MLNSIKLDGLNLGDYFLQWTQFINSDANIPEIISLLGIGKNNFNTEEANSILRYYIVPTDKRFLEIYLNLNSSSLISSIVWFFNDFSEKITIGDCITLFGKCEIKRVTYDDTVACLFNINSTLYGQTNILERDDKINIEDEVIRNWSFTLKDN